MIFYAMAIQQGTVLVCYRYKNCMHLILILSILYGTHFIATPVQVSKKVSEYDQEIPQSQTADNPMAPRGRAAQNQIWQPPWMTGWMSP